MHTVFCGSMYREVFHGFCAKHIWSCCFRNAKKYEKRDAVNAANPKRSAKPAPSQPSQPAAPAAPTKSKQRSAPAPATEEGEPQKRRRTKGR